MTRNLSVIAARKIAHRGLHDRAKGIVENTASAFTAAMAKGFAFEWVEGVPRDGQPQWELRLRWDVLTE